MTCRLYFAISVLDRFINIPYKLFSTLNDKTKTLAVKPQDLVNSLYYQQCCCTLVLDKLNAICEWSQDFLAANVW